jgi:anti-sigma factor RsiW
MNASSTCRDGTDRLMEYMDGVLDDVLRQAIDTHLAGCARCRAFVRSYTAVPAVLRDATHSTLTADAQDALRRVLAGRRR